MSNKAIIEGLLYIVGEDGLSLDKITSSLEISEEEAKECLKAIEEEYASQEHGIELVCYGSLYRFVSKSEVNDAAIKVFQMNKTATLSPSALETLAIIAYKQPITRVEIEEIRGVSCDMMLRKLISRNLIQECGRADAPGRPFLYEVTQEFMDVFKLVSLNELPELPTYESSDNDALFD